MHRLLLVILLSAPWLGRTQHNLLISQYMYNGLTLNPAYAGSQHRYSVAFVYRDQWTGIEGTPNYKLLTMHTPLFGNRVGAGLFFNQEEVGVHSNRNVYGQVAYKMQLGEGFLSMGLAGGGSFRRSNYTDLVLREADDPLFAGRIDYFTPNVGVGFYYYNTKLYAGLSAPYLLPTHAVPVAAGTVGAFRGEPPLYLTAGTVMGRARAVKMYPSFLYRLRGFGGFPTSTMDLNMNFIFYGTLMTGLSYRLNTSAVLLTYLLLTKNLRITYSYDIFLAPGLIRSVAGTHEVMLNYRTQIFRVRQRCSAYF